MWNQTWMAFVTFNNTEKSAGLKGDSAGWPAPEKSPHTDPGTHLKRALAPAVNHSAQLSAGAVVPICRVRMRTDLKICTPLDVKTTQRGGKKKKPLQGSVWTFALPKICKVALKCRNQEAKILIITSY